MDWTESCWYDPPQALDVTNYNEAYRPNAVTSLTGSPPAPYQVRLSWDPSNVHAEAFFDIWRWCWGSSSWCVDVGNADKNASSITLYNQPSGSQKYLVAGYTYALNNPFGPGTEVTVNVQSGTPLLEDNFDSGSLNTNLWGTAIGTGTLLYDGFDSGSLNTALWGTAVAGGAAISQSDGYLKISVPAAANAYADVYSKSSFPVGTTFKARVYVSKGQGYDHKGIGYANGKVWADCGSGESQAAMWRGQDTDKYTETKTSSTSYNCWFKESNYPAAWRIIEIRRVSNTQVDFYEGGDLLRTHTSYIPTGYLPIRFSAYTYTVKPGAAITIWVDWVKVSQP